MSINWKELFKIRISNPDETRQKHEVVKLLLVMKLMRKYVKQKNFIRIYTEFELDNKLICDIYFENTRSKSVLAYEIQKDYSKNWLETKTKEYSTWSVPYMNSADWIPINLNELSDDLKELNKQLDKYVF
jgi:hypothetical protein